MECMYKEGGAQVCTGGSAPGANIPYSSSLWAAAAASSSLARGHVGVGVGVSQEHIGAAASLHTA